jgi:hypothetical protein
MGGSSMAQSRPENKQATSRNYFVDEAGDGSLFNRKGHVIVGDEGCSRFFMLGMLDVADPAGLAERLDSLRKALVKEPYFKGVPSMQPDAGKTAIAFHAKDYLPEIRREVFAVLAQADVGFQAVVKRKQTVVEYVLSRNAGSGAYHYHPNELYDFTVRRLFKQLLHTETLYNVCFARRGNSDRTGALRSALQAAQQRFSQEMGLGADSAFTVWPCPSARCACLQAVDYFLWALQRLYERREERYLAAIWDRCKLVMDVDDTREARYGVYYTKRRPLSIAALDDC